MNGEPVGMVEGTGKTLGDGSGLALGGMWVGGNWKKAEYWPWAETLSLP